MGATAKLKSLISEKGDQFTLYGLLYLPGHSRFSYYHPLLYTTINYNLHGVILSPDSLVINYSVRVVAIGTSSKCIKKKIPSLSINTACVV